MRRALLILALLTFFAGCASQQDTIATRREQPFPSALAARAMPSGPLLDSTVMTAGASDHRSAMYARAAAASGRRAVQSISLNLAYIPSAASQVVVAPDGSLWALSTAPAGPDKSIWHWNGSVWSNIPGAAQRIVAAGDGSLWAMTSYGGLYHYVNGTWPFAGGPVQDLAVDPLGNVYVSIKNSDNQLWVYKSASGWQRINGYGLRLYAYPDNSLYVVIAGGAIYNSASYGAAGYNLCPGNASDLVTIAAGAGFYALAYTTNIAAGALISKFTPVTNGDCRTGSYQATNAIGTQIASNGTTLAVLGTDQAIYTAQLTATPTPSPTPSPSPTPGPITGLTASWSGNGSFATSAPAVTATQGSGSVPIGALSPIEFAAIGQSVTVSLAQPNFSGPFTYGLGYFTNQPGNCQGNISVTAKSPQFVITALAGTFPNCVVFFYGSGGFGGAYIYVGVTGAVTLTGVGG